MILFIVCVGMRTSRYNESHHGSAVTLIPIMKQEPVSFSKVSFPSIPAITARGGGGGYAVYSIHEAWIISELLIPVMDNEAREIANKKITIAGRPARSHSIPFVESFYPCKQTVSS